MSASERTGLLAPTRGSLTLASDIDMLEEFAYLRTQEGGKIHLETGIKASESGEQAGHVIMEVAL